MDSSKTVTLSPSGRQFEVIPGRSLLHAGLSAGLALPFRCSNGSCGECRAKILQGTVHKDRPHDYVLTENEKANGIYLLCSCTTDTDVVLEITEASSVEDIPWQELLAKRCRFTDFGGVTLAGFKFVRGNAFRFLPGQQATLTFEDGFTITLPIASCPCNAQFVEFHLSDDQLGALLRQELETRIEQLKPLSKVAISGPAGRFTLSNNTEKTKVFIATGGAFSRLQGLIEQVFNLDLGITTYLLWQASETTGQYQHNLCRSWDDAVDEFTYLPLNPEQGLMELLQQRIPAWNETEFYLAEHDDLLFAALQQEGVASHSIYCAPPLLSGSLLSPEQSK